MTTKESLWRMIDEAPAAFARSRPIRMTSYSASLLVIGNWSQMTHSMISPFRDWRTTPIPPTRLLDDPSIWTFQRVTLQSLASPVVNSVMKSAKAWALIAVLGQYRMSNSLSPIAQMTLDYPLSSKEDCPFELLWYGLGSTAWACELLWLEWRPTFP